MTDPVPSPILRFFSPTSIWNTPLAPNAPIAAGSAAITGTLLDNVNAGLSSRSGPWINTSSYSTPIYTVPANQPRVPVVMDNPNQPLREAMSSVPVPDDAQAAAGSDAEMTIYQPATDTLWEMWKMRQESGQWHAGYGGRIIGQALSPGYYRNVQDPDGDYIEEASWGVTASGLPVAGGLITLADLAAGHIDHALAIMVPRAAKDEFVFPAQRTDGVSTAADAVPEGARFRLPPTLDLSQFSMPPVTREIAEAAQRYGFIVNDQTGSQVGFRAQDPTPLIRAGQPNPYLTYFSSGNGSYMAPNDLLTSFPWQDLEMVRPAQ